jgi:hypothetical protein
VVPWYSPPVNQTIIAPALQDPVVPQRANSLTQMAPDAARKATVTLVLLGVCLLVPAFFLWRNDHQVFAGILGLLGALSVFSAFSKKSLVAPCPFCDAPINGIVREPKKPQEVRCPKCYEYSVVSGGKVRPMDSSVSYDTPRFRSPVFEGAVWPAGCVACGAPPTRFDTLQDRTVNGLGMALGRVLVTRASLANLPYCDVHRGSVELLIRQDKKMDLKWCSLRMLRHYLALNRGKKSLGTAVTFRD